MSLEIPRPRPPLRSVCVFCGSAPGSRAEYADAATRLGRLIAQSGLTLVTGAGHVGLMGVIADAALAEGGRVLGVIPQALVERELAHGALSELLIVETMHQRKALMADKSDAFIALPGGYGTLDELFEILTWAQLGIHHKPIGMLNVLNFFDPLLTWIRQANSEGFLKHKHVDLLHVESDASLLLQALTNYIPQPDVSKWVDRADR